MVSALRSLLGGILSFLAEITKTPIGAAAVAACIVWPIASHHGAEQVEARYEAAAEKARIEAAAKADADREIAREQERALAASAAANDRVLEEITNVPIPETRPGVDCSGDVSRVLRIRPAR